MQQLKTQILPEVKLDQFEGPFDLLIELARAHKIDLTQVSLKDIAESFLNYIRSEKIAPSLQADFLVVGSTLLLLKVHQLLPDLTPEEETEINELTDRVRIYTLYRAQAHELKASWGTRMLLPAPERLRLDVSAAYPDISVDTLAQAFTHVIAKIKPPIDPDRHLRFRHRSLKECVEILSARIAQVQELLFQDELRGSSAQVAAVSFLAILEMTRSQQVTLQQAKPLESLLVRGTA